MESTWMMSNDTEGFWRIWITYHDKEFYIEWYCVIEGYWMMPNDTEGDLRKLKDIEEFWMILNDVDDIEQSCTILNQIESCWEYYIALSWAILNQIESYWACSTMLNDNTKFCEIILRLLIGLEWCGTTLNQIEYIERSWMIWNRIERYWMM